MKDGTPKQKVKRDQQVLMLEWTSSQEVFLEKVASAEGEVSGIIPIPFTKHEIKFTGGASIGVLVEKRRLENQQY